jgi:hypothetical protein
MLQREETIRSKSPEAVAQELWGVLLAYNLVRLEMEPIADEVTVAPVRVGFMAALRLIVAEWGWATITASPGAIPGTSAICGTRSAASSYRSGGPPASTRGR